MVCNNCQKDFPESSKQCPHCGNTVSIIDFGDISETNYDNRINIKTYEYNKEDKKKFNKWLLIFPFIIIIIFVSCLFLFIQYRKEENIFVDFVIKINEYIEEKQILYPKTGNYVLNLNINNEERNINGSYDIDFLNSKINFKGTVDDPKKNSGEIILNDQNLNFVLNINNNNLNLYSKELYEKNIVFNLDFFPDFLNDFKISPSFYKKSLIDALKKLTYQKEKKEINIQGKMQKLNAVSLTLDETNTTIFFDEFYSSLINDSKFINEIAKMENKTPQEKIDEFKQIIANKQYNYSDAKFIIYYDKKNIVCLEITFIKNEVNNKIQISFGEQKYYLEYEQNDKNIISSSLALNITSKEHNYDITFDMDGLVIDATLKISEADIPYFEEDNFESININDLSDSEEQKLKNKFLYYFNNTLILEELKNACLKK